MTGTDANTQDPRPAVTTVLTPIMIALVHFGIPWQPLPKPQPSHPTPSWRGFLCASLGAAFLYTALDQGQRLDRFHSSLIIGLVAAGAFLIVAAMASAGHCCTRGGQMRSTHYERVEMMTSGSAALRELHAAARLCLPLAFMASVLVSSCVAQQPSASPMQLTLEQAINLALKQNHSVHLRELSVEQMQSKKDEARSDYLPQLKTSGSVLHVTELAGVEIPAGALGSYSSTGPIPAKSLFVGQGGLTGYTGGVGLEQPLTQLFRIHQGNVAAKQDLLVARTQLDQTQDAIALQVRQLYYNILINQEKLKASQEQLTTAQIKDEESRNDVARGNALEISALQSKAAILQAQQESLTLRLQGNDLRRQLADVFGLPVETPLELDPGAAAVAVDIPSRADAIGIALEQNHELKAARQTLVKAQAGLAAAKDAYIPDVTALSRYSYQSGVPLLVHNFGTFGFSLSYDLFDGGRREAKIREARTEVHSSEVAVDKLQSEIEVQIEGIYERVDELRQMVDVAEQVVKVRTEAARLSDRQVEQNVALNSARSQSHSDLASATASLLEANCGLSLTEADLKRAIGQMPQ
jgi:outer membrane protein TolC